MQDLIERQAAIDSICRTVCDNPEICESPCDEIKVLEIMPSAQPEPLDEWCTDCKEYDHERHCCPRWNRVIRQTLKDMKEEQPEIIRCRDCTKSQYDTLFNQHWCNGREVREDFYCGDAERRTDEGD